MLYATPFAQKGAPFKTHVYPPAAGLDTSVKAVDEAGNGVDMADPPEPVDALPPAAGVEEPAGADEPEPDSPDPPNVLEAAAGDEGSPLEPPPFVEEEAGKTVGVAAVEVVEVVGAGGVVKPC